MEGYETEIWRFETYWHEVGTCQGKRFSFCIIETNSLQSNLSHNVSIKSKRDKHDIWYPIYKWKKVYMPAPSEHCA